MSDEPLIVEPVRATPPGLRWHPVNGGPSVLELLDKKLKSDADAKARVQESAGRILGRSMEPGSLGQETGLVVGYVQSGKTLSFTTVAALARENKFQLIIVIAGTSIQLSEQSKDRLRVDLGITPDRPRTWAPFVNPLKADAPNIQRILDEWRTGGMPSGARRTVLLTVMKQHKHLEHLTEMLTALNLTGVSALVVDDEADQASLNNDVADGTQSTTYQKLLAVRACLPSHTLLQYTATPQAPLLISIIDTLSPNFVEVLDPGPDYTGGIAFFQANTRLVRTVPIGDIPTQAAPLTGAPESLRDALRIFLLGVAAGLRSDGGAGNRSMLVHPSHRTDPHQEFHTWISDIFDEWRVVIALADGDGDRTQLVDEFRQSYLDLKETVLDIPSFEELLPWLSSAFNQTSIKEVNRRKGTKPVIIEWGQSYGWILVGGQAMDRGYTIEGLTVTYMPRGVGSRHADTVQQRARFFGYKRPYLGYCRVYLEAGAQAAFQAYIEHEEFMRAQLKQVAQQGSHLNEWKRSFVLDPGLKPCRDSVLQFSYVRSLISSEWFAPGSVIADEATHVFNRRLISDYLATLNMAEDEGHSDRTGIQRHTVATDASLRTAVDALIAQYRVHDPVDSQRLLGVLMQLAHALEDGRDEPCTVYRMSSGLARERGINKKDRLLFLYQGAAPVAPLAKRGSVYPGDQAIHAPDAVTIQVHNLTLTRDKVPFAYDIPVLAIWMPRRLARPLLVQDQPLQGND
jgi:hypothetical protein